ncbi:hypothetical protein LZ30DRAFT_265987 [Colletotrichum cereale]|nr:hypothetical protein LZ30DRAFT_265987 [Colletotrichum cereale]
MTTWDEAPLGGSEVLGHGFPLPTYRDTVACCPAQAWLVWKWFELSARERGLGDGHLEFDTRMGRNTLANSPRSRRKRLSGASSAGGVWQPNADHKYSACGHQTHLDTGVGEAVDARRIGHMAWRSTNHTEYSRQFYFSTSATASKGDLNATSRPLDCSIKGKWTASIVLPMGWCQLALLFGPCQSFAGARSGLVGPGILPRNIRCYTSRGVSGDFIAMKSFFFSSSIPPSLFPLFSTLTVLSLFISDLQTIS